MMKFDTASSDEKKLEISLGYNPRPSHALKTKPATHPWSLNNFVGHHVSHTSHL